MARRRGRLHGPYQCPLPSERPAIPHRPERVISPIARLPAWKARRWLMIATHEWLMATLGNCSGHAPTPKRRATGCCQAAGWAAITAAQQMEHVRRDGPGAQQQQDKTGVEPVKDVAQSSPPACGWAIRASPGWVATSTIWNHGGGKTGQTVRRFGDAGEIKLRAAGWLPPGRDYRGHQRVHRRTARPTTEAGDGRGPVARCHNQPRRLTQRRRADHRH
jgi:hypothetical protein